MAESKEKLNNADDKTHPLIEDSQYRRYVIDKVREGLESVERDGGLTREQIEERLSKWLLL